MENEKMPVDMPTEETTEVMETQVEPAVETANEMAEVTEDAVEAPVVDAAPKEDEEPSKEVKKEKAQTAKKKPVKAHYIDTGNDLVQADMPEQVQASDVDEMRRAMRQNKILYAKVIAVERMQDGGVKIVAKRGTIRVVFIPVDFFKHSLMKEMDNISEEEKNNRYKRKATRMLGAVVSFIPRSVDEFTDDFGNVVPFVIGSRSDALEAMQREYFFNKNEARNVKVGDATKASILSTGPRYVLIEAFGVETTLGTGALSAFEFIDDVSEKYKTGDGIMVAIEALEVNKETKNINVRMSHAMLERLTSKVEGVSDSMIGGRYMATVLSASDKYYYVVLDGLKIRGVIPKTANISDEMLVPGQKVSMLVRYVSHEKNMVIGGAHKM